MAGWFGSFAFGESLAEGLADAGSSDIRHLDEEQCKKLE